MAESGTFLLLQAPAKVNLRLQIVAKRADGYHELDSVMQKLDIFDTVRLERLQHPGIQLRCSNSDLPEDGSNLVYRAAASFLQETGLAGTHGVSMILEKHIPVAAGLGGGSSDAGVVLTGLNRLFGTGLSEKELLGLATPLGADVPFFVFPGAAAHAGGIGERLNGVDSLEKCSVLLANPGFSVSTAWVYENFTLTRTDKASILSDSPENVSQGDGCFSLVNDLERVTIERYPEIGLIKECMLENGAAGALMSGSGPTVFGLFPDAGASDVLCCADTLRRKYGEGVFVTRPLADGGGSIL